MSDTANAARSVVYPTLHPKSIFVNRPARQRQENVSNIDDLVQSMGQLGLINPVVVKTHADGRHELIAGERRLRASLALNWQSIPVRHFNSLSPREASAIELAENLKRSDLTWRDQTKAIGDFHNLCKTEEPKWSIEKTANDLGFTRAYVNEILTVYDVLDSLQIARAEGIKQAYNTLQRFAERKAASIVGDLIVRGSTLFGNLAAVIAPSDEFVTISAIATIEESPQSSDLNIDLAATVDDITFIPRDSIPVAVVQAYVPPTDPVICTNFLEWAKTYNGPKFSLVHCDFPYGNYRGGDSQGSLSATDTDEFYDNTESVYWNLVDGLCTNLDRIMSYSSHLMFWFNMNFYTETVQRFRQIGLMVHDHPLIWTKSEGGGGGRGVVPGNAVMYPRRMYDTALLCCRGNRPLAKPGDNRYVAPTIGNKIHPSQKPEPMLRHFLGMLVDETTTMLDPTCGSAAALRAAEDLGAKYILGLELDPNYAKDANIRTLQARVLRQAGQIRREESPAG